MSVTMKSIIDYVPEVVSDTAGATEVEILFALRSAIRKFLKKTELWIEELPELNTVLLQRTYFPAIGYDADIARILWIKIKSSTADVFEDMVAVDEDTYDLVEDNGIYFNHSTFAPQYAVTDGMLIKAVLIPTFEALELPVKIVNEHIETMIFGAKEILARTPNRPYTNPKAEADNRFLYNSGLSTALAEKSRNNKTKSRGVSA